MVLALAVLQRVDMDLFHYLLICFLIFLFSGIVRVGHFFMDCFENVSHQGSFWRFLDIVVCFFMSGFALYILVTAPHL